MSTSAASPGRRMRTIWAVAVLLSLAVHVAIGAAAIALRRSVTPPEPAVLEPVDIVMAEPARRPVPGPLHRAAVPQRTAPAAPHDRSVQTGSSARAPLTGAAPHRASATPEIEQKMRQQSPPVPAPRPVVTGDAVVFAPLPRPRPAIAVSATASLPRVKPRLDPAPLPPAGKAAPDAASHSPVQDAALVVPRSAADIPAVLGGGGVSDARPMAGNPVPPYPRRARRRGLEGRVVLRVAVAPDGTVASVQIVESSGHAVLDDAARGAVAAWRFSPARRAGIPVVSTIDVPVSFRLEQ